MRERGNIWAIALYTDLKGLSCTLKDEKDEGEGLHMVCVYVCVKGLWSISSIQLDDRERGYMGNDTVCRCKGFIEYTVR